VAFLVLGLSFVIEGASWIRAVRQIRREKAEAGRTLLAHLRVSDDPTVQTVFYEDTAALIGLVLAFGGVGLHLLTGSAVWDGLASLLIGVLLAAVAYLLGRTNMGLLIGQQADPRMIRAVYSRLSAKPEVQQVVDLLTMLLGTDKVLLCARVDFIDRLSADEVERACVRIDDELRREFSDLDEIFIEPVPRTDPRLRARVVNRYGSVLENLRQDSVPPIT
jgi:divalent metal cation (Fe/Co/Zn/Cd) transporter